MAYDQDVKKRDGIADAAIATNRILKLGSAGRDHVVQCGANELPVAVSPSGTHDRDTSNAADTGDQVEIYYGGLIKIAAGAETLVDEWVKSDANGKGVPIDETTASAVQNHIGKCVRGASAEDEIMTVQIEIGTRTAVAV